MGMEVFPRTVTLYWNLIHKGIMNIDRSQMIMDSFLNNNPDHMVRLICEKQSTVIL